MSEFFLNFATKKIKCKFPTEMSKIFFFQLKNLYRAKYMMKQPTSCVLYNADRLS